MAVELSRFLDEQLDELPEAHPDRKFLEGIRSKTQTYLSHRYPTPYSKGGFLRAGLHIAEYFTAARVGSRLDPDRIVRLLNNPVLTESTIGYGNCLLEGIRREGDDSTVHLCLPRGVLNSLQRGGINTIPQLREKLSSVGAICSIGSFGLATIINSLDTFDKLRVAEVEATNRPVL
ncbi:hypothetical protein HY384_02770 [Candidatus Daviesbacteria bacterium]|nr:hypothetical protein [Candidatus Daviesbacteria bacterium]